MGSIRIRRTSFGSDLNNRLNNIALTPTDLPEPVVPATSKWGIFARSTTTGFPEISCPKASVRFEGELLKAWEDKISVSLTIFLFVFGISIPTYDLPSITSTTLTLLTDNDLAISWAIPVILLALVPGAGWISNLVTTGPGRTDSTLASIPNSWSFVSRRSAICLSSSSDNDDPSSSALSRSSVLGMTALESDSLLGVLSISFNFVSVVFGRSGCFVSEEITLVEKSDTFSDFVDWCFFCFIATFFSNLFSLIEFFCSFNLVRMYEPAFISLVKNSSE